MNIYKSDYIEISFDSQKSIITNEWFSVTSQMTDEIYKKEMLKFVEFVKIHKPKFHLIKSLNFLYVITIEMQNWTNENVFPVLAQNGIKKISFLVSSEIIAQMSIEQALEENNASVFEIKYFDSEKSAIDWLS